MSFLARRSSSFQVHSTKPWSKVLLAGALLASLLSVAACGSEDEADAESTTSVTYCDVAPIIASRCLRCHGEPLQNHAPVALTSFDAIHANYPSDTTNPLYKLVQVKVSAGDMPPPADFLQVDPPVDQLTEQEKSLLLDWLSGGAPRGEGCTTP
jgi:hypothetical protein